MVFFTALIFAVDKSSEQDILALLKSHPEKGMEELCTVYLDSLYHFSLSYTNDRQLAEDMVQEVFVTIWESRNSLEKIDSIKSYLYKMVRNRILNHYRAEAVKSKYSKELIKTQAYHENAVDEYMASQEYDFIYYSALAELPTKRRTIFELSRKHDLSYDEIATTLGVSKSFVKKQIVLALKHFKASITKQAEISLILVVWLVN